MTTTTISEVEAQVLAQKVIDFKLAKKQLEDQIEGLENQLRDYVTETGTMEIGALKAYTRTSPTKLVSTGKALSKIELELCSILDPAYVNKKLDASSIAKAWATDGNLRTTCAKYGVSPEAGEEKIYFKHAV
jgi:hypothetical protein